LAIVPDIIALARRSCAMMVQLTGGHTLSFDGARTDVRRTLQCLVYLIDNDLEWVVNFEVVYGVAKEVTAQQLEGAEFEDLLNRWQMEG
jgi:hypothetical protein